MAVGIVCTHTLSTLEVKMQPVKATINNLYFNWPHVSAGATTRITIVLVVLVYAIFIHEMGN